MTERDGFGKRRAHTDARSAWESYGSQMKAIGKSLSMKQWVFGALGLYVGIHLLVQSNTASSKSAASAAAPVAHAVQSSTLVKPSCAITLQQYNKVSTGMSQREVTSIYGCPGTEISRVAAGGVQSVVVSWPASDGFASTDASFDNDRLVGKAQLGLE